jgi:hypothetical protein
LKVRCIINCTGPGYENFKTGEIRNMRKDLADKLILFRYAEPVYSKNNKSE